MHGPIASALMNAGKHVYGQKPLTHNLKECRHLTKLAREKGLMTQMGIQVSSDFNERWTQALIKAGAIGKVKEVHSFTNKEWGDTAPVPQKSTRCRRIRMGPVARAGARSGRSSRATIIPATGANAATSAPAPSATWAATCSADGSAALDLTAPSA